MINHNYCISYFYIFFICVAARIISNLLICLRFQCFSKFLLPLDHLRCNLFLSLQLGLNLPKFLCVLYVLVVFDIFQLFLSVLVIPATGFYCEVIVMAR